MSTDDDFSPRGGHGRSPSRNAARRSAPTSGPVRPFAWGFALGCLASGILAVIITNAPVPLISSGQAPAAASATSGGGSAANPASGGGSSSEAKGKTPAASSNTPPASPAAPAASSAAAPSAGVFIQVGAYRSREDAERQQAQMALMGFESRVTPAGDDGLVRVRLGPYATAAQANEVRARLSESGVSSSLVR